MSRPRFNRANVEPVLDLIRDYGAARFDVLKARLESEFNMRFSFRSGTHTARLMGTEGTGTAGERDALDAWARAARRRLLKEQG